MLMSMSRSKIYARANVTGKALRSVSFETGHTFCNSLVGSAESFDILQVVSLINGRSPVLPPRELMKWSLESALEL
jgi:hypothetical protein